MSKADEEIEDMLPDDDLAEVDYRLMQGDEEDEI